MYSKIPYCPGYPHCHDVHGIEITAIKVTICEYCTVLGIYCSPQIPIRQLCQAVSEVLDTISTENNIIIGDFNVNWLIEADRQPLWNLPVRDRCYKPLITTYTTDNRTLIDHIFTNISHIFTNISHIYKHISLKDTSRCFRDFTDYKAVWASFQSAIN